MYPLSQRRLEGGRGAVSNFLDEAEKGGVLHKL